MSLGRLTASIARGTVETTATLANLNFDFSLISIQAPPEFEGFGAALSPIRRKAAEGGKAHTTARKLGALFGPLLPSTPELIKAYGLRASEIARSFVAAEKSSNEYGVFSVQAGIDGTTLWASATSGDGAIKVHLLACMLARIWRPSEATSIWVEIVEKRKREIVATFEESTSAETELTAYMAAKQEITRDELRDWDASARAWLRIADDARTLQQKQLQLVLGGFDIAVNDRPVLFESVLQTWKEALSGMESLIKGTSQRVQSGEILLGLSAFHLYPNLNVLAANKPLIYQNDPHVRGILTVGILSKDHPITGGLQWSLPLAHLRYYGDPVQTTGTVSAEGSRLTVDEFLQAVLGCILGGWDVNNDDTEGALRWLMDLYDQVTLRLANEYTAAGHPLPAFSKTWLSVLSSAAEQYLSSKGLQQKTNAKLLALGKRSFHFLGRPREPFFGLGKCDRFLRIQGSTENRIRGLRKIAEQTSYTTHDAFIRYRPHPRSSFEYATAIPRQRSNDFHASSAEETGHIRWIPPTKVGSFDSTLNAGSPSFPCSDLKSFDALFSDALSPTVVTDVQRRGSHYPEERICMLELGDIRTWQGASKDKPAITWNQPGESARVNRFQHWIGDADTAALFIAMDVPSPQPPRSFEFCDLSGLFDPGNLASNKLLQELNQGIEATGPHYLRSLRGIAAVAELYKVALDASIDVRVFSKSLNGAHWIRSPSPPCSSSNPYPEEPSLDLHPQERGPKDTLGNSDDGHAQYRKVSAVKREKQANSKDLAFGKRRWSEESEIVREETVDNKKRRMAASKKYADLMKGDVEDESAITIDIDTAEEIDINTESIPESKNSPRGGSTADDSESDVNLDSEVVMSPMNPSQVAAAEFKNGFEDIMTAREDQEPKAVGIMEDMGDETGNLPYEESTTINTQGIWISDRLEELSEQLAPLNLSQSGSFACIIMLESGSFNISPQRLSDVMAISSGDSIFIAAPMLCDPYEVPKGREIRRVVGNIGRAGMALLIPPAVPRIRKPRLEDWRLINHAHWDGNDSDCFISTTLHLSYTGSVVPLHLGVRGAQDTEVYMLESVVSVYERGKWIADLDILKSLRESSLLFRPPTKKVPDLCSMPPGEEPPGEDAPNGIAESIKKTLTVLESWPEFLERPERNSIFMADNNWQAKLAATSITIAQGCEAHILSKDPCWSCVSHTAGRKEDGKGFVIIK
jgi:hypothetical protein